MFLYFFVSSYTLLRKLVLSLRLVIGKINHIFLKTRSVLLLLVVENVGTFLQDASMAERFHA